MIDLSFGTDVEINGERVSAEALGADLEVKSEAGPERRIRACFTNRSGKTIRFGGFRFELRTFHGIPGERIRIYREGWTMTSASGSVRYGECDFDADPDYLKYAVSDPGNYRSDEPNHFSAEHVVVLNDRDTGYSLLAGFVSSADQLTRFDVVLNEQGLARFSAFSCCDGIEVAPGEAIHSEELVIFDGDDGYGLLERFAGLWGKRMNALVQGQIPTGWCSWYYYFHGVTENDILENLRYLVSHRQQFPLEYIQLDEGYQAMLGDWLTCNEAFPHGLEFLAREIRDGGFKPGVWVAPYMVDERSRLFAGHPDWMIHDADGEIIRVTTWHGGRVAALDTTHPGALAYLTEVFTTLAQWGFEYFKLDFLVYACAGTGGCYYDRKATRAQALRRGMQAIRNAVGDRFLLGCTAPLGQVIGLVDSNRIGTDIPSRWQPDHKIYKEAPTVPNVCRNIINRSYMNGRLWISDSDAHTARSDNTRLTENEVVLWTFALYFTGGSVILSDRFETLTPERAKLSQLLLAEPGIFATRPLDVFEREFPAVWLRRKKSTGQILVGLFNFESEVCALSVDLDKIETGKEFDLSDFRTGEKMGTIRKNFTMAVQPHSCRILNLELIN